MFFIKIMYVIDYGATRGTGALTFRGILESGMNFGGPRFFMQSSSSCGKLFAISPEKYSCGKVRPGNDCKSSNDAGYERFDIQS